MINVHMNIYSARVSKTKDAQRHQPYRIRKAQFVLTAELMVRYFAGFKTRKPAMEWVEEALRKRQFVRFDLGTLGI